MFTSIFPTNDHVPTAGKSGDISNLTGSKKNRCNTCLWSFGTWVATWSPVVVNPFQRAGTCGASAGKPHVKSTWVARDSWIFRVCPICRRRASLQKPEGETRRCRPCQIQLFAHCSLRQFGGFPERWRICQKPLRGRKKGLSWIISKFGPYFSSHGFSMFIIFYRHTPEIAMFRYSYSFICLAMKWPPWKKIELNHPLDLPFQIRWTPWNIWKIPISETQILAGRDHCCRSLSG